MENKKKEIDMSKLVVKTWDELSEEQRNSIKHQVKGTSKFSCLICGNTTDKCEHTPFD